MTHYTGHSAKHDGLQGHSVGEYYPIITTIYGDNTHGLILGGFELRGNTRERNYDLRETLYVIYTIQGWEAALEYFERIGAKPVNSREESKAQSKPKLQISKEYAGYSYRELRDLVASGVEIYEEVGDTPKD